MKFPVSDNDAVARLTEVLQTITSSDEWQRHSHLLVDSNWYEARETFRRFFDLYEGTTGEEWLGIMENMVIERCSCAVLRSLLIRQPLKLSLRGWSAIRTSGYSAD